MHRIRPPRDRRFTRVAWEVAGVALSVAFALVALGHALAGAKRSLLLTDGDSVLLPLIAQSLQRGDAVEWGMSPVLFVFPEIPLYLVAAAVTTTVAAALLLNGVFNVVLLYGLLRFVAGRVSKGRLQDPGGRPPRPVAAALTGVALFTIACLLETRPGGNSGEIASLYLVTTYYSGTVMAVVSTLGLVLHLHRPRASGERPRFVLSAAGLALLAALATWSNPLYLVWAVAPSCLALVVFALMRYREALVAAPRAASRATSQSVGAERLWRALAPPASAATALVVGAGVGYAGRAPLSAFIIADNREYFRWGQVALSGDFYVDAARGLVATPGGALEAVAAGVLLIASLVAGVVVVARRSTEPASLGLLVVASTVVVVPIALLVTGSIATRYALPYVFAPLIGVVIVLAVVPRPASTLVRRGASVVALVAVIATIVVTIPTGSGVIQTAARPGDPAASCLATWARGKNVTGVAQYWAGRSLATYGGSSVHLLQVTADLHVYPWLVTLAPYRGAKMSYVIVDRNAPGDEHPEYWGAELNHLGNPADVVDCQTYDIYDYRGTPGAARLTAEVERSAEVQASLRGFGW